MSCGKQPHQTHTISKVEEWARGDGARVVEKEAVESACTSSPSPLPRLGGSSPGADASVPGLESSRLKSETWGQLRPWDRGEGRPVSAALGDCPSREVRGDGRYRPAAIRSWEGMLALLTPGVGPGADLESIRGAAVEASIRGAAVEAVGRHGSDSWDACGCMLCK